MSATFIPGWLRRIEETLGTLLLMLIFGTVALQVVGRFVFDAPPFWTEELARYLFVWLVCIGSAEVARTRDHITMDIFALMLPPKLGKILQIIINAVVASTLVILVWYGTFGAMRAGRVDSIALGVPESLLYGALPVGAAFMTFRLVAALFFDFVTLWRGEVSAGGLS